MKGGSETLFLQNHGEEEKTPIVVFFAEQVILVAI